MKFILSILAVLAIVFLVGCSAKDTRDNKLSNSEITKLGKKYGGVYVFNKKFEKEIDDREKEREAVNRQILDEVSRISDKDERNKKMRKLLKERYYGNPKIAQTLSNGKKYYTATRAYGEDYNKQAKLPEIYKEKIINFIGQEDYNKFKPSMLLSYFYVDDNKNIIPIVVSVYYTIGYTKFGFFGDEGRGFSLSRRDVKDVGGDSVFYLEDLEQR
ncbi:tRNA 2-selenouridine synthase [Campylobacter rectus]|uniref:tRNA 2-selenouridine synthase n=1 Tax=Campylobacter rectus TaxID=203 RepID=A0A6G5QQ85_CAMRE|nr:tRNA 2-selenouridine synthase [Campylobacter rectus]QCD47781.1 hypothetical protein CRECT_2180 [Campylobacter rectus]UEB48476.1 tRNA 2-selenouridine synthase [Campylobacter rectus]